MLPEGGGAVVITLADVYKQVLMLAARVDASLSRQEQLDRVVAEHEADLRPLADAAERIKDHESRIRTIERSRWPMGSIMMIIALASLAVAIAAMFIKT